MSTSTFQRWSTFRLTGDQKTQMFASLLFVNSLLHWGWRARSFSRGCQWGIPMKILMPGEWYDLRFRALTIIINNDSDLAKYGCTLGTGQHYRSKITSDNLEKYLLATSNVLIYLRCRTFSSGSKVALTLTWESEVLNRTCCHSFVMISSHVFYSCFKEDETQLQWIFESVDIDEDFPMGVKATYRAFARDEVVEIVRAPDPPITFSGRLIGLDVIRTRVVINPTNNPNGRKDGMFILKKLPSTPLVVADFVEGSRRELEKTLGNFFSSFSLFFLFSE